jgi:hypothetical protein
MSELARTNGLIALSLLSCRLIPALKNRSGAR